MFLKRRSENELDVLKVLNNYTWNELMSCAKELYISRQYKKIIKNIFENATFGDKSMLYIMLRLELNLIASINLYKPTFDEYYSIKNSNETTFQLISRLFKIDPIIDYSPFLLFKFNYNYKQITGLELKDNRIFTFLSEQQYSNQGIADVLILLNYFFDGGNDTLYIQGVLGSGYKTFINVFMKASNCYFGPSKLAHKAVLNKVSKKLPSFIISDTIEEKKYRLTFHRICELKNDYETVMDASRFLKTSGSIKNVHTLINFIK